MASNWRFDVWRLGLNNGWPGEEISGIAYGGLIARLLDVGPGEAWIMQSTNPNFFWFVANLGGDQGYKAVSLGTVPSTRRHFPYGRLVTPD